MQRLNALARPHALGAVKDGASRQAVTALAGKLHDKAELTVAERKGRKKRHEAEKCISL